MIGQEEKLRIFARKCDACVRDYNEIMLQLDAEEKDLFQEHIKRRTKELTLPSRFSWASKGVIEWYVKDCRKIVLAHANLS